MTSYRLLISYEGTGYKGWQKNQTLPTIEQCLEQSLTQIRQSPFRLEAASRTDAGVHATAQVLRLDLLKPLENAHAFVIGLNSQLPLDIRVLSVSECNSSFHPSLDAKSKTYDYFICNSTVQLPYHRLFSWHVSMPLNIEAMQQAASDLIGLHDFRAFTTYRNHEPYENCVRELYQLDVIILDEGRIKIRVRGNYFMYKMVRNLVGTLTDVGKAKIKPSQITCILESKKRSLAGVTAPAHGLFLTKIEY